MVNEEIYNGLKAGLERGESLKKATMTFFNSGYKKEEISEAAKLLENYQPTMPMQQPFQPQQMPQPFQQPFQQPFPQQFPQQIPQQFPGQMQYQQPYQQYPTPASNYMPPAQNKAIIFVLIFLLLFLVGLLAVIFLFREEIVNLFSNMFA